MMGKDSNTFAGNKGAVQAAATPAIARAAAWPAPVEILLSPWTWIGAVVVGCAVLLLVPVKLAIGGYYWDLYLYPDAAWRIANGQLPNVDFFTPAGPLEYLGFASLARIFPAGHDLLVAQWWLLLFTLPLIGWIVPDMQQSRGRLALAVVLPFLFFSLAPINTKEVYPLAGVDGYGVYNRHVCLLLYVLVAALVFVRDQGKLAMLCGVLFTLLFLTKITGAVVGGGVILYALLSGRLSGWSAAIAAAIFLATAAALELSSGMMSAYLRDIDTLIGMNAGGLLERFRSPVVMYLDILAPLVALSLLLAWVERRRVAVLVTQRNGLTLRSRVAALLDQDAMWIWLLICIAIVFETQNTGSLAFTFVWPYLAHLFAQWHPRHRDRRTAVLLLIALATLPLFMPMLHRTARVVAASVFYGELNEPTLGKYAEVEAKPEFIERGYAMHRHYGSVPDRYAGLAGKGHQSSYLLYSEIDFQVSWLIAAREALTALQEYESKTHRKFGKLIVADFVDIFTPLLKREPVRLISIGMAAERTVPPLDGERLQVAMRADAVLVPLCPVTPVRLSLKQTLEPVLADMKRIDLTACWALYARS